MILTRQNVLHYLVQAGHLGLDRIVDGRIRVASRASRNRAFAVTDARGHGLFVKQYRPEDGHWHRDSSLDTEARVYALAAADARLAAVLPPFHAFDEQHQILVLGLVDPAETLRVHHRRTGRFSRAAAAAVGRGLATCHVELGKALRFGAADPDAGLPRHRPWILRPDRLQPYATDSQSAAQARVVAIVQRHPELIDRLQVLAAGWRTNGIVHGDMKWANCLVTDRGQGQRPAIRLVDWEMAGTGDVAWDVAGILQSCIIAWIRSTRPQPGDSVDTLTARAAGLRAPMQGAVGAFLRAYLARLDLERAAAATLLVSATGYAAARIVQTAFEASDDGTLVSGHGVLALQLAANMLADPPAAAATILGIAA